MLYFLVLRHLRLTIKHAKLWLRWLSYQTLRLLRLWDPTRMSKATFAHSRVSSFAMKYELGVFEVETPTRFKEAPAFRSYQEALLNSVGNARNTQSIGEKPHNRPDKVTEEVRQGKPGKGGSDVDGSRQSGNLS